MSPIAIDRSRRWPAGLLLGLAALAWVLVASGDVVAEERTVDELVAGVQRRFDATDDLRADVAQEVFLASLDRTVPASGTVVFKRPGKMRWDLDGDEPQIIVSDGKTVWFYQPADEQVLKAPLDSVFRSTTPVSFLTGVGKIADDFAVRIKSQTPDRIELLLDPKRAKEDLGSLELVVEPDSLDITEARITDPVGNVTDLKFSNRRRNTGVRDDAFDFEVPPGVDVVDAPIGY